MITDIEIELQAYLGTPHGASIAAEVGQEAVGLIFLAGARAQAGIDYADLQRIIARNAADPDGRAARACGRDLTFNQDDA
jgi:hypothetical protein